MRGRRDGDRLRGCTRRCRQRYEGDDGERSAKMLGAQTLTFEDRVQQLVPNGDSLADGLSACPWWRGGETAAKALPRSHESLTDVPKGAVVEEPAPIPLPNPAGESDLHVSADPKQPPVPMPVMRVFVPDDQLALF